MRHTGNKSDNVVVSAKQVNKTRIPRAAESVEKRTLLKGTSREQNKLRTQRREGLQSALERIRTVAKRDKGTKFNNLMHHVANKVTLQVAFDELERNAASGIDKVTWESYQERLDDNIADLSERLKRGGYRAKPVRRVFIPKPDGRERPIGVPALEDKLVQLATVLVLNAIYETDFLGFSYGFRPERNPHNALDAVYVGIFTKGVNFVMDADIEAFFDTMTHEWLMKFLGERIADQRVLRLIVKWLKAGVWYKGEVKVTDVGTPQGGSISPLLSNVFLHFVFDLWLQKWRKTEAKGDVTVVRYADDFVIGFKLKSDADACHQALRERFAKFGLKLHPTKTRVIEFGRFAKQNAKKRKRRKVSTFNFLGFTHICGETVGKKFTIWRRTIAKRKSAKLKMIAQELRRRMHRPIPDQGSYLKSVIEGHNRYYGVPGNCQALGSFRKGIIRHWRKTLTRRSQNGVISWDRMQRLANSWLPKPNIHHPYPPFRMGVFTQEKSRMR